MEIRGENLEWKAMGELLKEGKKLYEEVVELKESQRKRKQEGVAPKGRVKKTRKLLGKW